MKTVIQKTDELLEQLLGCDLRTEIGIDKAKKLIRLALKEQDRDTRHACAEAILECNEDFRGVRIWDDYAHDAVMNAKAV